MRTFGLCFLLLLTLATETLAEPLRIAVASNFKPALEQLLPAFSANHPDTEITLSAGASGQLFTQVSQGAPFDLFLSADAVYPSKLHAQGLAFAPLPYANGRLLLLSRTPASQWQGAVQNAARVALANPTLAPYGAAAKSLLEGAGLWRQPNLKAPVLASNIAQVQQWFDTGNVDVAFAAAALFKPDDSTQVFDLTALLEHPIEQHLVILKRSRLQASATEFCDYLRSQPVQQQLKQLGYSPIATPNREAADI